MCFFFFLSCYYENFIKQLPHFNIEFRVTLILCSQVMVIHIYLQTKLPLIPFTVKVVFVSINAYLVNADDYLSNIF